MREMKDSGVEWIGKIPSDWKHVLLKYVCKFKTGGTPKNKEGIDFDGEYPWITPNDFNESLHIRESKQKISHESVISNRYSLFPAGSTLLVCIASVGKVGIIEQDSYSNQQITALKPLSKIVPKFLMYATVACSDVITFKASSNVVPIINTKTLGTIAIPIPTLTVQTKIADFLDQKCSEIDALTSDIQTQIDTLEEYKKSVITEAVTKGLDPNVEMKDSGIEWIGKIPKSWPVIRLKYSSWLKGRIGWHGLRTDEFIEDEQKPYLITGTDFDNGYINWNTCVHISEERYMQDLAIHIKENDLLITKDGTIGKVAVAKNCPEKVSLNSGVFIIRNTRNYKYNDRYMYYLIQSEQFCKWFELSNSGNSTIRHLNQEKFYNFAFTYPAITEQTKIADFLDQKCLEIDQTISEKQQQLETLAEYKKSLIYEYVTGKREVA